MQRVSGSRNVSLAWLGCWIAVGSLATGCADEQAPTTSTTDGSRSSCVDDIVVAQDDDATRAVAEALCASVTDPAALVLERGRLASSDLSNLINTWCASGSP